MRGKCATKLRYAPTAKLINEFGRAAKTAGRRKIIGVLYRQAENY